MPKIIKLSNKTMAGFQLVQAECERLYQTRKQAVELIKSIEDFL